MSNLGYFFVGPGLLAGCIVAMAAVLFGAAGKRQRKDHREQVEEATAPNAVRMF